MLSAFADHLWQSLLCCTLGAGLALLARHGDALLRLWIWRICALKFFAPFAWLFALGEWCGFPVRFAADPAPVSLARAAAAATPWLAPVTSSALKSSEAALALAAALLAAAICARLVALGLRLERARVDSRQPSGDDAHGLRPLGFFNAALFTCCAMVVVSVPLLGGAISDRSLRIALLAENARALRDAPVTMSEATPGMGARHRVVASADGVLIRNANIRELVALSYGVPPSGVWANQMFSTETGPAATSWWLAPRYDVRLRAKLRAPEQFDPYALRQRITRLLVERFGIEIQVNGECQVPCGRWDRRHDLRPY